MRVTGAMPHQGALLAGYTAQIVGAADHLVGVNQSVELLTWVTFVSSSNSLPTMHSSEVTLRLFPVLLLCLHGFVKVNRLGGHVIVLLLVNVTRVGSVAIPRSRVLTKVFVRSLKS